MVFGAIVPQRTRDGGGAVDNSPYGAGDSKAGTSRQEARCLVFIEGVIYRITVGQSDNCYRAEWYCHQCADSSAVNADTLEQSAKLAFDRAYNHHDRLHKV
jgi:hypothetical protein